MRHNTLNLYGCSLLALTLAGCVLGTKVGDIQDSDSGGEMTEGHSSGAPDTATSAGEADTELTGSSSGGAPDACAGLDEAACVADPGCRTQLGSAFDFPGCTEAPQFLGCLAQDTACDLAIIPVCRDGTDEVYLNSDGCVPAGFSPCETALPLCGACEGLPEPACLADEACQGLYGAPHVEQDGKLCVAEPTVFLACAANGGACPPFVPTVCPEGDPETRFNVPSGCIPFGFEVCEGAETPECP